MFVAHWVLHKREIIQDIWYCIVLILALPLHEAGGVALLPRALSQRHPEHRDISDISQDSGA